jgi:hypothetical protein
MAEPPRKRIRCCVKARQCAAVDQPDRAICRRGRDFDRAGKFDHDRQAAAPQKSASGCGRFAEPLRPDRCRRPQGIHIFGRYAPQARYCHEPDRKTRSSFSSTNRPAGLDPEARIEVWKIVKELANGGTTVFLTTQNLEEAEQLADRIAILHEGRIIAGGTLAELKKLFPPAKVEYVEKQPTLEEIFLAIIGKKEKGKWNNE